MLPAATGYGPALELTRTQERAVAMRILVREAALAHVGDDLDGMPGLVRHARARSKPPFLEVLQLSKPTREHGGRLPIAEGSKDLGGAAPLVKPVRGAPNAHQGLAYIPIPPMAPMPPVIRAPSDWC